MGFAVPSSGFKVNARFRVDDDTSWTDLNAELGTSNLNLTTLTPSVNGDRTLCESATLDHSYGRGQG